VQKSSVFSLPSPECYGIILSSPAGLVCPGFIRLLAGSSVASHATSLVSIAYVDANASDRGLLYGCGRFRANLVDVGVRVKNFFSAHHRTLDSCILSRFVLTASNEFDYDSDSES